jgi:ABC-2 type transport system permease protein
MDPRNEPFPMQVQRQAGEITVFEIQQINYPFFVDVRQDSMAKDSPIVSNLPAVTLQWASAVEVDEAANEGREVVVLLQSTSASWLHSGTNVNPDQATYGELGFPVEGEQKAWPLAVSVKGSFDSYFQDRPSPFQEGQEPEAGEEGAGEGEAEGPFLGTIDASPESSRLVVVGSSEFLNDLVLDISRNISQDRYLYNLQLVQNAVDWTVEDEDLLSIRSRGTYARLLRDLDEQEQAFWEGVNYAVALLGLLALGVVWNVRQRSEEPIELTQ